MGAINRGHTLNRRMHPPAGLWQLTVSLPCRHQPFSLPNHASADRRVSQSHVSVS
jgi:hypothetical protein